MDTFTYIPNFIKSPDEVFNRLLNDLAWVRRDNTPRLEYYANKAEVPYTYGRGAGVREYLPMPWHIDMDSMRESLEALSGCSYEVCFLNRYEDQRDHLGWHADDSPEMDDARPIAIISLGVEREIYFRPQNDRENITKLKLGHGSLCLMHAGMQDTHYHKIPKAGFTCGQRISLTYRGYVLP